MFQQKFARQLDRKMSSNETFSIEAMVRGYHVYQEIWDAALGEQLTCSRETGNRQDPFAVAVVRSLVTVGHVPKKISSVCSMFLLWGGTICCRVTASRRYSGDLPQWGLEIPCMLTFEGGAKDIAKASKHVRYALSTSPETSTKEPNPETSSQDEPPKKMKHDSQDDGTSVSNEKLSDLHINLAQQLLKQQFPQLNGLQCTLSVKEACG